MAIDVNEEVRVWGGFAPGDFWCGVGVLMALAAISVSIGVQIGPMLGATAFFIFGGGFTGFMVYRRGLPKGILWRRFLQEGRFLFLKVPGLRGVDVYLAPANDRAKRFGDFFKGSHGQD